MNRNKIKYKLKDLNYQDRSYDYDKNLNYTYFIKYYINDLSDHQNGNDFSNHNLQSNIFYKKYYINNQNDYSIDKDYINDSKNHQIDYDKNRNYKSLYYKYKKKYFSLKK